MPLLLFVFPQTVIFICPHFKGGFRFAMSVLPSQSFMTKLEKWGHLCPVDIFLVWYILFVKIDWSATGIFSISITNTDKKQ